MHLQSPNARRIDTQIPTVWGLDPVQLHDRYWASRSVCVLRPGVSTPLPRRTDLFMLADSRTLALFSLGPLLNRLFWADPSVALVRLVCRQHEHCREVVRTSASGSFVGFNRLYAGEPRKLARVALTRDRRIARLWQQADSASTWRTFRHRIRGKRRQAMSVDGRCYDGYNPNELDQLVMDLVELWPRPDATIESIAEVSPGVWGWRGQPVDPNVLFLGPTWVGAGRSLVGRQTVLGPAALWDDTQNRPDATAIRWERLALMPFSLRSRSPIGARASWRRRSKRCFDFCFALMALTVTLPMYPVIMLAIWLEDGGPFLFTHRRETLGGREFPCLKFRSMKKDADRLKAELAARNQSDGPQFHIDDDPRVTRVGRLLRRTNLDELPQFFNVLCGHMSVVGPRPSPRKENQCCPAWREARLSVRPGITGLWQVSRTRRSGLDFQEWIKFDLEYVERASWRLDLMIIFRTVRIVLGGN